MDGDDGDPQPSAGEEKLTDLLLTSAPASATRAAMSLLPCLAAQ